MFTCFETVLVKVLFNWANQSWIARATKMDYSNNFQYVITYPLSIMVNGTTSASPPARVAIHSEKHKFQMSKLQTITGNHHIVWTCFGTRHNHLDLISNNGLAQRLIVSVKEAELSGDWWRCSGLQNLSVGFSGFENSGYDNTTLLLHLIHADLQTKKLI
jgi:hypothetical protein